MKDTPVQVIYAMARAVARLPINDLRPLPSPYDEILEKLESSDEANRSELLIGELEQRGIQAQPILKAISELDPNAPPPKAQQPPRKMIFSADELLSATFPEPKWAIPDLIPEGLTILGGRPKMGKSWWALEASLAKGSGGHFMGKDVTKGRVIFFSLEDSPKRLQRRMRAIDWSKGLDVTFCHDLSPIGGTLGGLSVLIESENPAMVVIDTLSRAAQGVDQRNVSIVSDFLGPIQVAAVNSGTAVLLIDHHRKPSTFGRSEDADHIDELMESSAKAAIADAIIGLFRKRGERGATLKVTGRDMEDQELAIEMDQTTCCWQLLGDAGDVRLKDRERKMIEALKAAGGSSYAEDLARVTGIAKNHISSTLLDLMQTGKVCKLPPLGHKIPYALVEGTGLMI